MRLLLFYQVIHVCRNWLITYLPINGLHLFCHNCLTTSLSTYDINEKYLLYILMISCHYCYSKLVGVFYGVAYCGVSYYQRVFMGSIHFAAIA